MITYENEQVLNLNNQQNDILPKKSLLKFIILSGIGISLFMLPIPKDGGMTRGISIATDFIEELLKTYITQIVFIITTISALGSLIDSVFKPDFIRSNKILNKLFSVSPVYLVTKIIGFLVCSSVVFNVGPEIIYSDDIGGSMVSLSGTLVAIAISLSFILPLLTDCGVMEFFGIMLRSAVRPTFKVPGRACVDMITSWLGSSNTAVLVTRQQYESGHYTKREAATIMTNFSLVSIPFCMVVASALDLNHIFPIFYISITIIGIILAMIEVRIPPLNRISDTYKCETCNTESEEIPEGKSKFQCAVEAGCKRAETFKFDDLISSGIENALDIVIDLIPIVIAWGTVGLYIANETPILQYISYPMGLFLKIFNVENAFEVAPATIVGFIDMFIPALITGASVAIKTKFIIGTLSLVQIIYLTEVGSIIMKSDVDLGIGKLILIFLERTFISLPIIILLSNIIPM